ncbi:MAG TPA: nucleotide-binding domain containing protein, partial [Rubrobacter sp.]|nr:nucleotide-binding domain containing protein [Rubrobacter sp.]
GRAEVAGQMLPGIVSAWILPEGSTYPGLPYVVFPGNVGDEDALVKVIQKLRGARPANDGRGGEQ